MKATNEKQPARSARLGKNGFSFVELTLVILLLGLIAIFAVPNTEDITPISLDSAARKVKEDLRYAQSLAMTTGDSHGFQVTGASTYQIYNATTANVVISPYHNAPMIEDLSNDFGNAQFQDLNYQIEFDDSGRPTLGGGTIITIVDGGGLKQIQVTATSGYITLL